MEFYQIKDLNKSYGYHTVFTNFTCKIIKNKRNFLIGYSGSGKSTLINLILGIDEYKGSINIEKNTKFSVVFQENRLLEYLTVYQNLNLVQKSRLDRNLVLNELFKIGLEDILDKKVNQLSGGMKRRVAILRCLLVDADIYILDEPFKELDSESYVLARNYFVNKTQGKTVIMTSHNKDEISILSDNSIVISKNEYVN